MGLPPRGGGSAADDQPQSARPRPIGGGSAIPRRAGDSTPARQRSDAEAADRLGDDAAGSVAGRNPRSGSSVAPVQLAESEKSDRMRDDSGGLRREPAGPTNRLHLQSGGLPGGLQILCFGPWRPRRQPHARPNRAAGLAARPRSPDGSRGRRLARDHQRGVHGHGRAAGQPPGGAARPSARSRRNGA